MRLSGEGGALARSILPLFENRERSMLAPRRSDERVTFDRLLAKLALHNDGWDTTY